MLQDIDFPCKLPLLFQIHSWWSGLYMEDFGYQADILFQRKEKIPFFCRSLLIPYLSPFFIFAVRQPNYTPYSLPFKYFSFHI